MKRICAALFTTLLGGSVLLVGQQVGPDGRLQRAGEKTAAQQEAEKKAAAQQPPPQQPAPAKPAPAKTAEAKPAPALAPKKAAAAAAEPKLINGIPEGAVQLEPYTWSWTDSLGKEWLYHRTPFGVSRIARADTERPANGTGQGGVAPSQIPQLKVTEAGDVLQFEQNSPFGVRKWTKKKDELNSDEQAAWDRLKKKD